MPSQKPMTTGTKASCPHAALRSREGKRRLHTDAATMTPAAKPVKTRCTERDSSCVKKRHSQRRGISPEKAGQDFVALLPYNTTFLSFYFTEKLTIVNINNHVLFSYKDITKFHLIILYRYCYELILIY